MIDPLTDKRNKEAWHRVELAIEEIFDRALALGGTLSGEHGTGLAKALLFAKKTGMSSILFSRRLRKALDQNGILNQGKITG